MPRVVLEACSDGEGGAASGGGVGADTGAQPPLLGIGELEEGWDVPTVAHPERVGGSTGATEELAGAVAVAHPPFLKPPPPLVDSVPATDARATGGFVIFTPAAFAILRSSFSSRLRSFSLRLFTSSSVLRLAR